MLSHNATVVLMPARPRLERVPAQSISKSSLARFIDAMEAPVVLVDRRGSISAMNGPARDLFAGHEAHPLRQFIEGTARKITSEGREGWTSNQTRVVDLSPGHVAATFIHAGADLAAQDIGAMVLLRRMSNAVHGPTLAERTLVTRFGLTRQEVRVALLLAEHRSNRDVAARLGLSVHTARHHTERVLAKLQIRSRHDVKRVMSQVVTP